MKREFFIVSLTIIAIAVFIAPVSLFAAHTCKVVNEQQIGQQGVTVTFMIETAIGLWEEDEQLTNEWGVATSDLEEHSTAEAWEVELDSQESPVNPETSVQELDYDIDGYHADWVIE